MKQISVSDWVGRLTELAGQLVPLHKLARRSRDLARPIVEERDLKEVLIDGTERRLPRPQHTGWTVVARSVAPSRTSSWWPGVGCCGAAKLGSAVHRSLGGLRASVPSSRIGLRQKTNWRIHVCSTPVKPSSTPSLLGVTSPGAPLLPQMSAALGATVRQIPRTCAGPQSPSKSARIDSNSTH